MMSLTEHLENVRQKPEPVRKQLALGIAVALTGVIALFWLSVSLATGAFAINSTELGKTPALAEKPASVTAFSSFLGAAGAACGGVSGDDRL